MLYIIRWLTSSEFFVLMFTFECFFFSLPQQSLVQMASRVTSYLRNLSKQDNFCSSVVTKLYHRFIKPQVVLEESHSACPGTGLQISSPAWARYSAPSGCFVCSSVFSLRGALHAGGYSIPKVGQGEQSLFHKTSAPTYLQVQADAN